ncbi:MAG: RAMP superfamily CRISPR-associated protein [Bryobacterales bacterium]|nr:RAMP superfamily CRISPR-associated protein [Bryobacterales bacterium]
MRKLTLSVVFHSAMHHGSGFGMSGLLDRTILRDSDGMPYLAGSALKGRFRNAALRIAVAEGADPCQYADQPRLCSSDEPCVICLLFGSPRRQGQVYFSDAYPVEEIKRFFRALSEVRRQHPFDPRDAAIRAATAIDRARGVVRPQLLFTTETLPPDIRFVSTLCGNWDDAGEALLRNAAGILTHFGADASRGLGSCHYKLE